MDITTTAWISCIPRIYFFASVLISVNHDISFQTDIIKKVCLKAKEYAEETANLPVSVYLVDSTMQVADKVQAQTLPHHPQLRAQLPGDF